MSEPLTITVNSRDFTAALHNFSSAIRTEDLLKIAGAVMRGSIEQTFRDQGSPAGSWPPLAASTIRRDKTAGAGRLMLIKSGRLKNSITQQISGNALLIGSNLVYAAIQQLGGNAGRGHKAHIPARPYLVFRPEDPERITEAMQAYIDAQAKGAGL